MRKEKAVRTKRTEAQAMQMTPITQCEVKNLKLGTESSPSSHEGASSAREQTGLIGRESFLAAF